MFASMLLFAIAFITDPTHPDSSAPPRAEVLIVGTFHFNSNSDLVKSANHDVMSDKFQAEVNQVVGRLAKFNPNKIVVEYPANDQVKLDTLYADYKAGNRKLAKSERDQLGARLAKQLGHDRLYAFDQPSDLDFKPLMDNAQKAGRADLLGELQSKTAEITKASAAISAKYTVAEHLAILNHPPIIEEMHSLYIWLLNFDTPENRPAAALLTSWYLRNLNMFENLQRIAKPGDRILVLVGAGHTKHLRDFVGQDSTLTLSETAPLLPNPPLTSMTQATTEQ
ncbi:MAG: hypothetical protein KF805_02840 [Phycisphaeraceae bacterium]|nr:hypothetical protein [Phycisphaeraceae bacterium]